MSIDWDKRYAALLFRRSGGDTKVMAEEDAQFAAKVPAARALTQDELLAAAARAKLDAVTDPDWKQPTPAQAKSGEYYKPTMPWHGLTINIENPAGTVREGVDETGKPWRTVFDYAYGEIAETLGTDGDPVDVYIGPYADAQEVYIVRQMKRKKWDQFDEDKVMIDFPSLEAARTAYCNHYDDPRFFGGILAMPLAEFLLKVKAKKQQGKMLKAALLFRFKS